jgi:transcriptional regulator with XRE-family HTH domain
MTHNSVAADPDHRSVGRTFRELREQKEISVEELAASAATTPRRVEAVEEGCDPLRYDLFRRLADGLGVSPSEIIRRASRGTRDRYGQGSVPEARDHGSDR